MGMGFAAFCLFAPLAGAQSTPANDAPVRMAPVTAGPLGAVGIRCAVGVGALGVLGSFFGSPHIESMTITEVTEGSAAQHAGLRVGDAIARIGGVAVTSYTVTGLREATSKSKGDLLVMEIVSPGSKPRTVPITLGGWKTLPK